ncbi:hypothetical protein ABS764_12410 [Flavobacterium sp. ST-87]|uniref:Uncharacterized protein n=1 Tax=Flavobacterium plantiphilum TaxID=3163297 RepID=A0ABW8XUS9_9FLAO
MERNQNVKRLYWWGLVGLMPNFGLIAGIILLWKGIVKYKDRTLIFIGSACIAFTFIFWLFITKMIEESPVFNDANVEFAKNNLNSSVKSIEFYKYKFGEYPEKLQQAREKTEFTWDPFLKGNQKMGDLQYQRSKDKYILFSVGVDGIPNTADDIFPTITKGDTIKFGLIKSNSY